MENDFSEDVIETISKIQIPKNTNKIIGLGVVFMLVLKVFPLLLLVFGVLACAIATPPEPEVSATIHVTTEYESKRLGVRRHAKDGRGLDEPIENELRRFGMRVVEKPHAKVDVWVTYIDRWMWDLTTYLLSLEISFTDAHTGDVLAVGKSRRVSVVRASPGQMAREAIKLMLRSNAGLPATEAGAL